MATGPLKMMIFLIVLLLSDLLLIKINLGSRFYVVQSNTSNGDAEYCNW